MKMFVLSWTVFGALSAILVSGCQYAEVEPRGYAFPNEMTFNLHLKKGGQPYAHKSIYFTMTANFPNGGGIHTFNSGGQTDADGNVSINARDVLCMTRADWSVLVTSVTTGYTLGTSSSIYSTTEAMIPRSICSRFVYEESVLRVRQAKEKLEGKAHLDSDKLEDFVDTYGIAFEERDFAPRIVGNMNNQIVPIEVGVISVGLDESTGGRILGTKMSGEFSTQKTYGDYGDEIFHKKYTVTTDVEFDFDASNTDAPGVFELTE